MKFNDLKFTNGTCQIDYNYYVLSFTKVEDNNCYVCAVFNRAKLPVDLPGVKTEKILNNKWVKINFNQIDIDAMLQKFWAITGIQYPNFLKENEFYKDIF